MSTCNRFWWCDGSQCPECGGVPALPDAPPAVSLRGYHDLCPVCRVMHLARIDDAVLPCPVCVLAARVEALEARWCPRCGERAHPLSREGGNAPKREARR